MGKYVPPHAGSGEGRASVSKNIYVLRESINENIL